MLAHPLFALVRIALALIGAATLWVSYVWSLPNRAPASITDPQGASVLAFMVAAGLFLVLAALMLLRPVRTRMIDLIGDAALTGGYVLIISTLLDSYEVRLAASAIIVREIAVAFILHRSAKPLIPTAWLRGWLFRSDLVLLGVIAAGLAGAAFGGVNAPYAFEAWAASLWIGALLRMWTGWLYWSAHKA